MRGLNHIKVADTDVALCGWTVTGGPVDGQPTCTTCATALVRIANQNANRVIWTWPEPEKRERAMSA